MASAGNQNRSNSYHRTPSGGYPYNNNNNPNQNKNDLVWWIVTIALLVTIWPVGLILLIRRLMGLDRHRPVQPMHPYDIQHGAGRTTSPGTGTTRGTGTTQSPAWNTSASYTPKGGPAPGQSSAKYSGYTKAQAPYTGGAAQHRPSQPIRMNRGKGLAIGGGVLAGLSLVGMLHELFYWWGDWIWALEDMSEFLPVLLVGVVLLVFGIRQQKKSKRFRRYLSLIGRNQSISVDTLAQAMPVSVDQACDDLQEMLDRGILSQGYLDMSIGKLILSADGLRDEPPAAKEKKAEPEAEQQSDNAAAVLAEIRRVNDAIADETMSRKIDRIEAITGKIFAYQKQNPGKDGQLRGFLNYYLPTTLKILNAYAQMEAQGIEGENIRQTKERIEGMMDKVVEGFEKQLDRLFQDRAMDITSDVAVLEQMLEKDGLSKDQGMTLGG